MTKYYTNTINILNTLGKIDYSMIDSYKNFLSPYQTPTDDVDSFIFGCADPQASNYYLDISGSLSSDLQLIDDGTCNYQHNVTIHVGGPSGIQDAIPVPITIQAGIGDDVRTGTHDTTAQNQEQLTITNWQEPIPNPIAIGLPFLENTMYASWRPSPSNPT